MRNSDGRDGVITLEDGFGPWLDLHIKCVDGSKAMVKLSGIGRDTGEAGWQWWCPEFCFGEAWIPLGELGAPLEYVVEDGGSGEGNLGGINAA